MSCQDCQALMMDALYSEEIDPQSCFAFFKHLDACDDCRGEYLELLETRETLARWELEERPDSLPEPAAWTQEGRWARLRRLGWWTFAREIAAGILILVGAATVLQGVGLWGGDRLTVSKQGLMEMMNDVYVENSAEDRRVFARALVNFADDLHQQRLTDQKEIAERIFRLQDQLLNMQEENNHYLKTLASR